MNKFFLKDVKIGLDLDEVVVDFLSGYLKWFKIDTDIRDVNNFDFSYSVNENLDKLSDDFWLSLKPKINPNDLNFLPTAYISKRKFDVEITKQWIEKNGFPCKPVYHVTTSSKYDKIIESGIDFYVDDSIRNFQDLNSRGVKTFLMDTHQNRQFDVGDYRLHHIRELPTKIETYLNHSI